MFGTLFRLLGRVAAPLLRTLGTAGKGKATIAGVAAIASGAVAKQFVGDVVTADNIVAIIKASADVLQALGTIIAAFGIGRKAGYGVSET